MAKMKTLTVSGQTYTVMDPEAVHFTAQSLTLQQQRQVRENIGAAAGGTLTAQVAEGILIVTFMGLTAQILNGILVVA